MANCHEWQLRSANVLVGSAVQHDVVCIPEVLASFLHNERK